MTASTRPVVWSVAGSDSGGGAGIQADVKALDACAVHACTAVAALTAQNSCAAERIEAVSPAMLEAQLAALGADLPPQAIKTGMLGTVENLRVVARCVDRLRAAHPRAAIALVVDPVLAATTGARFADEALLQAYRDELLPRATLITPNRREAARLLGLDHALRDDADIERAAHRLAQDCGAAVAITGGDAAERGVGGTARDYVAAPHGHGWLALPRVDTPHHHGTGCVFAATAAAALAQGFVEIDAAILAKMGTTQALRNGYAAGSGAGPVRPGSGFAALRANLPTLGDDTRTGSRAFAPLANPDLGLYAIVDTAAWVERVLAAGVRSVQLRIKDAGTAQLSAEIERAVRAARTVGAQLFVNDHWGLAIEHGAYGVHLGQEDLAQADLETIHAAGLRLGVSTHAYWEVCRAHALRPSYVACGPVHPTRVKAMPWIAQGEENLAYWCALLDLPVVAIGGIDAARARTAARLGAAGIAVVGAIVGAESPETAIRELRRAVALGASEGRDGDRAAPPARARPTLARAGLARNQSEPLPIALP
jgi:hydroxymethylpyrimidine kinase/phosphomethylpyrimidine kinase/thiamine-phosphate diphosphorylase